MRQALALGSAVPLLMCVMWTAVALGLVPFVPGGPFLDPVDKLLGYVNLGVCLCVRACVNEGLPSHRRSFLSVLSILCFFPQEMQRK